jgi:hypothetical protein
MTATVSPTAMALVTTPERAEVKARWAPITSLLSRLTRSAGAGTGEEGHGHRLDVVEHRPPQVEDEPFADAGRLEALEEPEAGGGEGQGGDGGGQDHDGPQGPPLDDGVDRLAGEHGRGHPHHRAGGGQGQEGGQGPAVGPGETGHPPQRGPVQPPPLALVLHGALQRHPHRNVHASGPYKLKLA